MPRKKKTKEAKPDAAPEAIVTVAAPEEASNSPATPLDGGTPEPIATVFVPETTVSRVAPETNANRNSEQQGRSNNRSRNKNRNKNKKEARPDALPGGVASVVSPNEESTPPEPAANRVVPQPTANRTAPEPAVNLVAPPSTHNPTAPEAAASRVAPETTTNKTLEQPDRSNNRSRNKNKNKNKKEAKPEPVEEEIVNFIEEENGIENPDLVTVNMICTNVALLQTILDVQVKILAKLNNQELGQVNAQVDTLYKKYRKNALDDLMRFDKDA